MKCSTCNGTLQEPSIHLDEVPFLPTYCPTCQSIRIIDIATSEVVYVEKINDKAECEIPPLRVRTPVYVNNKEHLLFLEQGKITKRDHKHYRVKLVSTNKQWDGKSIWFPSHWIKELPKF